MAQFDVHETRDGAWVVECQSDDHDDMQTRLVVPLAEEGRIRENYPRMNPTFVVEERRMSFYPQGMGTIPISEFRRQVASLEYERDDIIQAIDLLITGV